MRYKTLIFDFDGTLCDTSNGIINSIFYAIDALKLDIDKAKLDTNRFIGPPLISIFQEYLGVDLKTAEQMVVKFRERYDTKCCEESTLYPGTQPLLQQLKADDFTLGIASSKPTKYIEAILGSNGVLQYFDTVCGVTLENSSEPKADIIGRTVEALHADKSTTLVIGDTHYDIDAARANGIAALGVCWGFGSEESLTEAGAKYIARTQDDIESIACGFFEKITKSSEIYNGKIIRLQKNEVELSDGSLSQREVIKHNGGAAICALTDEGEVLMARQYHAGAGRILTELPAGKLEIGEDPMECAIRELKEECGATAEQVFSLGKIYPTPAYDSEITYIYGAVGLTFSEATPDTGEFLEIYKMPLMRAAELCMKDEISDAKTVTGILKVKELVSQNKLPLQGKIKFKD